MANPTHPNRVVRVKDLNRFKAKLDEAGVTVTIASVETCESILDELT